MAEPALLWESGGLSSGQDRLAVGLFPLASFGEDIIEGEASETDPW